LEGKELIKSINIPGAHVGGGGGVSWLGVGEGGAHKIKNKYIPGAHEGGGSGVSWLNVGEGGAHKIKNKYIPGAHVGGGGGVARLGVGGGGALRGHVEGGGAFPASLLPVTGGGVAGGAVGSAN
jgi:hypothetical protein